MRRRSSAQDALHEGILREDEGVLAEDTSAYLRFLLHDVVDDVDDVAGSVEVVDMRTQRLLQVGDDAERDGAETPRHAHRPLRGEVDVCVEAASGWAALVADHEPLPRRVLQEIRVESAHRKVFLQSRNGVGVEEVHG